MNQQDQVTKTQSVINRSVVKAYALKVSAERRAGTFTRVSEDFLTAVEAQVEAAIRQLAPPSENPVSPDDDREFVTGRAMDNLREKLNARTRAIIQGKVRAHPTIGCTLKD